MLGRVGRMSTILAVVGWTVVFLALVPAVQSVPSTNQALFTAFNLLGAATALASFVSWFTAIYHWGTRYEGDGESRRRWGVAVTFGLFIGAWFYWLREGGEKHVA